MIAMIHYIDGFQHITVRSLRMLHPSLTHTSLNSKHRRAILMAAGGSMPELATTMVGTFSESAVGVGGYPEYFHVHLYVIHIHILARWASVPS